MLSARFGRKTLSASTSPSFDTAGNPGLTPTGKFTFTPSSDNAGDDLKVYFTAKDLPTRGRSKSVTESVEIHVKRSSSDDDSNDESDDDGDETVTPATTNVAPTLLVTSTVDAVVGQSLALPLTATDPNGDKVNFRISGKKPAGVKLARKGRNAQTGHYEAVLTYTPKPADAGKTKRVKIAVADNAKKANQATTTIEINVAP